MTETVLISMPISDFQSLICGCVNACLKQQEPRLSVVSNEDNFLSINEASVFLKKAKATIYGLVSQNKIPYMKQGKQLYFSRQALTEWIQTGRNKTQEEITAEIDAAIVNGKKKRG